MIYALTPPDTGKVKRIRSNGQVTVAPCTMKTVAPCTMKGTVADDVPVADGMARRLDAAETRRIQELMKRASSFSTGWYFCPTAFCASLARWSASR